MAAPYISLIPTGTSESSFWWQRHVQAGIGMQFYPIPKSMADGNLLHGLRLYALAAAREYYDEEGDPEDSDLQIGADYYYDNLYGESDWLVFAYGMASYRTTNFSFEDYNALVACGNLKLGYRVPVGTAFVVPYAVADTTYVPRHEERWWENALRVGAGVRVYPLAGRARLAEFGGSSWLSEFLDRIHIYGEFLHCASWMGDEAPGSVEENDYRVGIALSTGSFVGER